MSMDEKDISMQFADILKKDVVDFVNNNKLLKGAELKSAQMTSLEEFLEKINLKFGNELSSGDYLNVVSYDDGSVSCLFSSNKTLGFKIYEDYMTKRKAFSQYSEEDWVEVLKSFGISVVKGSIRGRHILRLARSTGMSIPVASALISAAYGVCTLLIKIKNEDISYDEFLIKAEIICIDAAIIACGAALGQLTIPVPGLGAFIGALAGSILVWLIEKYFREQERDLLDKLNKSIEVLIKNLEQELHSFIRKFQKETKKEFFLENLFVQNTSIQNMYSADTTINEDITQKVPVNTIYS